jgi:hypothetical protein
MIKHIDLCFDKQKLISEFNSTQMHLHRPQKQKAETWFSNQSSWETVTLGGQCEETERIRKHLENVFKVSVTAMFFKLEENVGIPPHVDHGHRSALNIILSDEPAPVKYRGEEEEVYDCAILNVARRHEVLPGPERKMIKFKLGNLFFEEAIQLYSQNQMIY